MDLLLSIGERTEIRVDIVNRELPWVGVWPPLAAVSNVRFKCGPDGDLTGQCVVAFGDTLVLNNNWAANEVAARNVTFEGITFQRGINSFMELINGGDITFKNCGFRVSVLVACLDEQRCGIPSDAAHRNAFAT